MKIALGPVVQLYTRYMYQVVESAPSWFYYVSATSMAIEDLEFWRNFHVSSFSFQSNLRSYLLLMPVLQLGEFDY